jgi:hypothetical protein
MYETQMDKQSRISSHVMNVKAVATGLGIEESELVAQMQDEDAKYENDCKAAAQEFVSQFPGTPEHAIVAAYKKGGAGVQFSSQEKEDAFFSIQNKYRL